MNRKIDGRARRDLAALAVWTAVAALWIGDHCRADEAPTTIQPAPIVQGQRIFTCGHSFHVSAITN